MDRHAFSTQPKFKGFNLHISLLMAFDLISGIVDRFGPEHRAGGPDGGGGCVYAVENKGVLTPICIVGQMFADLGILRTLIVSSDHVEASTETDPSGMMCNLGGIFSAAEYLHPFGVTFDSLALTFLSSVQTAQDEGNTWACALEESSASLIESGLVVVPETRTARERLHSALDD